MTILTKFLKYNISHINYSYNFGWGYVANLGYQRGVPNLKVTDQIEISLSASN